MKYVCVCSHRDHLPDGKFKDYVSGEEYDVENPSPAFFKPIAEEVPTIGKQKKK